MNRPQRRMGLTVIILVNTTRKTGFCKKRHALSLLDLSMAIRAGKLVCWLDKKLLLFLYPSNSMEGFGRKRPGRAAFLEDCYAYHHLLFGLYGG